MKNERAAAIRRSLAQRGVHLLARVQAFGSVRRHRQRGAFRG